MIIDFHTHCFPDKLAQKAIPKLSYVSGGLIPNTDGTADGLKKQMREQNIDISVVMNIATNPTQQKNVNDFAGSINNLSDIYSFGSVHPHAPDAIEELERIKAMGMKGVKLHPDYQGFEVDDIKLKPIYKKISSLGLITLFHAGADYGFAPPYGCTPEKMATALTWFDTPVIAAHWGGIGYSEDVLKFLCGTDIYFDTAFGYSMIPKFYVQQIIKKHGTSKIVFGTDTPWHTPYMEMCLLNSLDLDDADMENIKYKTAKKLLNIK